MSKFIDRITERLTGQKRAMPVEFDFLEVSTDISPAIDLGIQKEYVIHVEWGFKVFTEPKHIKHVIDNAVSQLKEDVYGDFRNRILDLERAYFQRNIDDMQKIIRELKREVF